jgi:hypothetical protein
VAPGDASIEVQETGGVGQELPETSRLRMFVADVHKHAERKFPFTHVEVASDVVHGHSCIGCEALGRKVSRCAQDLGNAHGSIVARRQLVELIGAAA